MKLTVCYGHVKIIVPCGEGELTVNALIEKSTARYRKATGKSSLDHVSVKYLQTVEGGILDSDDIIADICDDRDTLVAVFEETIRHRPENNGDSASTTSSIESHQDSVTNTFDRIQPVAPPPEFQNVPTHKSPPTIVDALPPRMNRDERNGPSMANKPRKERPWRSNESSKTSHTSSSASSTPMSSPDVVKNKQRFPGFDRDLNRKSLSVGHPLLYSWIDAQEKINDNAMYSPGFASDQQGSLDKQFSPSRDSFSNPSTADFDDLDDLSSSASEEIELENDRMLDMGLKVQGYKNAEGKELGLIVHEVKRINAGRQGSLNVADRITEVNGVNLRGKTNAEAEAILNRALVSGALKLKRTRSHRFITKDSTKMPLSEKPSTLPRIADSVISKSKEAPRPKRVVQNEIHEAPIEDPEDLKPVPKALTGKKIRIALMKGKNGLGFTITSRDVITNGPSPVFVKNILVNGAAIQDGRLQIGDQILQINDIVVSGKEQSKVVEVLKKSTGLVHLIVNREIKESTEVDENEEAMETVSDDSGISAPKDEILKITMPLNDLGPAGLGISVKGKAAAIESCDLGIYIKSIIHGGAAAKDGRLRPDDRILRLEDVSLEGMPNDKAMDIMRNTMRSAVKKGALRIIVSRKAKKESPQAQTPVISATKPQAEPIAINSTKPQTNTAVASSTKREQLPTTLKLPNIPTSDCNEKGKTEFTVTAAPIRTKSYFRALQKDLTDFQESRKADDKSTRNAVTQHSNSGKVVSVSSVEIPITQPSRTVLINRTPSTEKKAIGRMPSKERATAATTNATLSKHPVFSTEKDLFFQQPTTKPPKYQDSSIDPPSYANLPPPLYEEAMGSRSNSTSDSASSSKRSTLNGNNNKDSELRHSDADFIPRTMSTSSRFSLDSLMMSPDTLPFSRDAFGRLSISERKGRAHLDATKSDFYYKMKKYKSMEDISYSRDTEDSGVAAAKKLFGNRGSVEDDDADIVPLHEAMRRTESLDTLLSSSKISLPKGVNEDLAFHRGTATSSSTPWYAQRMVSPQALKLRSRSTAWNDSFRTAVDKTPVFYTTAADNVYKKKQEDESPDSTIPITLTSNAHYEANLKSKKKSGFLKGIGQFLKKGKQRRLSESRDENKPDSQQQQPHQQQQPQHQQPQQPQHQQQQQQPLDEKPIDLSRRQRPRSLNEETMRAQRQEMSAARLREQEKRKKEERLALLQRELQSMEQTELMINGGYEDLVMKPLDRTPRAQKATIVSPASYGMAVQMEQRIPKSRSEERKPDRSGDAQVAQEEKHPAVTVQGAHISQQRAQVNDARKPPLQHAKPAANEDPRLQQRFLPTNQLFYYGHQSLPRKFTMNHQRKSSAPDKNSTAYSIEAQTEIFKRANHNREETDLRNSSRSLRKTIQTHPEQGNITVSHAAKASSMKKHAVKSSILERGMDVISKGATLNSPNKKKQEKTTNLFIFLIFYSSIY
eukprot:gene3245-3726_t